MTCGAGVDGAPGGWAVVSRDRDRSTIRKVIAFSDLFDCLPGLEIVAVDIPIGLLECYEKGGRVCDRAARKLLGRPRGSSVFPAPIRPTLWAESWEHACALSRTSAPRGKAISKQTFGILPKVREVDAFLQTHIELRNAVREVHPEVSFRELAGRPMAYSKSSRAGREERRAALAYEFADLSEIEDAGRAQRLPIEDILDATVACW